jgi:hypothetical protein
MASSLFYSILKTGLSALLVVKWTFKYFKQDVGMHSTFLRLITSCRLPLAVVLPMSRFGRGRGATVGMLGDVSSVRDFL